MKKYSNTIIVTIHDLRNDSYYPALELQRTLQAMGSLAEIITPYNDLTLNRHWRIRVWNFLTHLSNKKRFSFILPIVFFWQGFEIYRNIKIHWRSYERILVYDQISALAARKATNNQLPITLLSQYGGDPYLSYLCKHGTERKSLGYFFTQKLLILFFHRPSRHLLSTS